MTSRPTPAGRGARTNAYPGADCPPRHMPEEIRADDAPTLERFPFSQAMAHGDTVYVSGQVPLDPETGELVAGGVAEQTDRIMANIAAILEAAGSSLDDALKATVFLTDMDDFRAFNEAYRAHFDEPFPARSAVEVSDLAGDFDVEVDLIAAR